MARDDEDFLRRWSRRKRDAAKAPSPAAAPAPQAPVPLPALDSLSFESDFKAFMRAQVEESAKRAALKKLFADPRFNLMDGLDVYIDDYTKGEPISPELLARLEHAKATLLGQEQAKQQAEAAGKAKADETQSQVAEAPAGEPRQKEDDGAAG